MWWLRAAFCRLRATAPPAAPQPRPGAVGGRGGGRADAAAARRAQSGAGVGGHAQRNRAARFGIARAGDDRAAGLRIGPVGYLHPHRLQYRFVPPADDDRPAGQRRPQFQQRRRDLLHGPPGSGHRRSAEGGPTEVRARRRQRLRRRARGLDRAHVVARIRRDAGRTVPGPSLRLGRRVGDQRRSKLPGHPALARGLRSDRRVLSGRRTSPAKRAGCCCGWIPPSCRPTRTC